MTDDLPGTGDRVAPEGSPPILVDTSQDPVAPQPQGDQPIAGSVFLVRDERPPTPTAGEYRAGGYTVPDHDSGPVPDDQTPGLVFADQRAPEGTVALVDAPVDLPARPIDPAAQPAEFEDSVETAEEARADASAEEQGRAAAAANEPRTSNPHDRRTTEGKAWDKGWSGGQPS